MINNKLNRIILASNNSNKVKELQSILKGFEILTLNDLNLSDLDIEENGSTFEENALIKARVLHKMYNDSFIIADDSGLTVEYLNNEPGIYSARYAGDHDDEANNKKLLKALEGVPENKRGAAYICVIALITPDGCEKTFKGRTLGRILEQPVGNNGFAYDPLFYSIECGKTFGETTNEEKNKVSHRSKALFYFKDYFMKNIIEKTIRFDPRILDLGDYVFSRDKLIKNKTPSDPNICMANFSYVLNNYDNIIIDTGKHLFIYCKDRNKLIEYDVILKHIEMIKCLNTNNITLIRNF